MGEHPHRHRRTRPLRWKLDRPVSTHTLLPTRPNPCRRPTSPPIPSRVSFTPDRNHERSGDESPTRIGSAFVSTRSGVCLRPPDEIVNRRRGHLADPGRRPSPNRPEVERRVWPPDPALRLDAGLDAGFIHRHEAKRAGTHGRRIGSCQIFGLRSHNIWGSETARADMRQGSSFTRPRFLHHRQHVRTETKRGCRPAGLATLSEPQAHRDVRPRRSGSNGSTNRPSTNHRRAIFPCLFSPHPV